MRLERKTAAGFVLCLATILPFLALAENLFDESGFQSYVSDKRAFRAGDALTVIIMENAEAKTESDRNVSREYGVSGGINGSGFNEAGDLAVGVGRQSGDVTQRAGALRAAMTVSVTAINESGNLEVVGSQRIALDGEEQLITVEGSVRPQDISADNTILSSRVIDARIVYNGYDIANDGTRRNWLYRALSKIGLI